MTTAARPVRRLTEELLADVQGVHRAAISATEPGVAAGLEALQQLTSDGHLGQCTLIAEEGELVPIGGVIAELIGTAKPIGGCRGCRVGAAGVRRWHRPPLPRHHRASTRGAARGLRRVEKAPGPTQAATAQRPGGGRRRSAPGGRRVRLRRQECGDVERRCGRGRGGSAPTGAWTRGRPDRHARGRTRGGTGRRGHHHG